MTTITIDAPVNLPKTHFSDINEFLPILAQYNFETELLADYADAKSFPISAWKSL